MDLCGCRSGRTVDKFALAHLTAVPASAIGAPLIAECPVSLECRIFQSIPLGSHEMFLADILAVQVDRALLDAAGRLCLEKADLLAYAHGGYFRLGQQLGSFGYSVKKKKKPRPRRPAPRGGEKEIKPALQRQAASLPKGGERCGLPFLCGQVPPDSARRRGEICFCGDECPLGSAGRKAPCAGGFFGAGGENSSCIGRRKAAAAPLWQSGGAAGTAATQKPASGAFPPAHNAPKAGRSPLRRAVFVTNLLKMKKF